MFAGLAPAADPPPEGTQVGAAAHQARFLEGVEALHAGNPMRAATIFEPLLAETGSPRVKLELARALFLLGQYERSERLFREVLAQPDLPWRVGENIRAYLDEIDMATGYVRFSLGIVSDSNPRNFTSSREVMIGGQTLTVVPPEDNRSVHGVRLSVRGYRPLDEQHRTTAFFTASYSDFPARTFDRLTGDAGVAQTVPGVRWLKAKAGFEGSRLGGETLYRFPYVGALAAMAPSDGYRLLGEFKFGRLQVPEMPYLDAHNLFLIGKLAHPPAFGLAFSNEVTLERSETRESPYSYRGGGLGGTVVWPSAAWDARFTLYGSVGLRRYDAIDPIFGDRRSDTRYVASLDLLRPSLRIRGYRPQIGVVYEKTDSTLDFYSFSKLGLRFQLED
ncbi:MAG TPA: porin family protein [Thiobacillaceae bacterium]|nr:porin family protein [Thiobacillaceae bacterium]